VDVKSIDLNRHADFVLGRVLSLGDAEAVHCLRREFGDDALRDFVARAPHRLDARSRRFFEVVLNVSESTCKQAPFRKRKEQLFRH
jgi:hypothetical protein